MIRTKVALAVGLAALALVANPLPVTGAEQGDSEKVRVMGKVTSLEGQQITLDTPRRGALTVEFDSNTDWVHGSQSDLAVGAMVAVAGTGTDPIHAIKIGVWKEGERPRKDGHRPRAHDGRRRHHRPHLIKGEITALGDDQFILKTRRGDVTVRYDNDTKFVNGTSEDLDVADLVGVAGRIERPEIASVEGRARVADRRARAQLRLQNGEAVILARYIVFPKGSPEAGSS